MSVKQTLKCGRNIKSVALFVGLFNLSQEFCVAMLLYLPFSLTWLLLLLFFVSVAAVVSTVVHAIVALPMVFV